MEFTDLLTISMPCYERKDYFREALESALNQTVKCKIIVIDNCSSHDYFKTVCEEKGVSYYRNDTNIGMAANFAKGFELAETKYVTSLQDDDRLSPEYVESFLNAVNQYPDLDIFYTNFYRFTNNKKIPHQHTLPYGYMEKGDKIIEYGIQYKLGFPYITSAIKRNIIHAFHGAYAGSGSYDWVWVYSVADQYSFYGESKELYMFREHDQQDTQLNYINYALTIPYIYDIVLKEKVGDISLKNKARKTAFWKLIYLKSIANKSIIKKYLTEDNIYGNYLKDKLNDHMLLKIIFMLPKWFVRISYKSFRKIGFKF